MSEQSIIYVTLRCFWLGGYCSKVLHGVQLSVNEIWFPHMGQYTTHDTG